MGGFSAIEIASDGKQFWAVTDRAHLATGQLRRENGRITGFDSFELQRLKGPGGNWLPAVQRDSEGIARRADGRIYISFEWYHRVWTYSAPGSEAAWLPRHPDFKDMQTNSSFEALAIGPDNALYTLPERSGTLTRPFPVYRYRDGAWDIPFAIPRDGHWLPVGADFDDDGHLYILTRYFSGWSFASRITRYSLPDLASEIVYESPTGRHGNLEGISLWRDATGALRALLISDNNFRSIQRSEIVEVQLPN